MLIERDVSGLPVVDDLVRASVVIERLSLDAGERAAIATKIFEAALEVLGSGADPPDAMLLGCRFQAETIRQALERAYRDLARTANGDEKIQLIERANHLRQQSRMNDVLDVIVTINARRIQHQLQLRPPEDLVNQVYPLDSDSLLVGRQDCDITLPDPSLSRRHAEILRSGNDWVIRDLGSANGTRVNGQLVPASRPRAIRGGEFFSLVVKSAGVDVNPDQGQSPIQAIFNRVFRRG
jgi:hypothetical protein